MDEPLLEESWAVDADSGNEHDRTAGLPSWLQEENDGEHAASVSGENDGGPSRGRPTPAAGSTAWADDGAAGAAASDDAAWDRDDTVGGGGSGGSESAKILLGMRIANVGTAVLLMASSITVMTTVLTWPPTSPAHWVLGAYATLGGLLLLCIESPISSLRTCVALNFGFLYDPLLRLIFHALMGSLAWNFHTTLGDLAAVALGVLAPANTYILCTKPTYCAERDAALEEEERLLEAHAREERRRAVREIADRWADGNL